MNIYKRMIRPMINPPSLQGMNDSPYPLISDDYWVDDEHEEVKRGVWEQEVKREDKMGSLLVEEKYVLVEQQQDYNKGYTDGYKEGYKNGVNDCRRIITHHNVPKYNVYIKHYKDKGDCKGDEDV